MWSVTASGSEQMADQPNALVFGGLGSIGDAVATALAEHDQRVFRTSRVPVADNHDVFAIDPFESQGPGLGGLDDLPELQAVVWAQGVNAGDSVGRFDRSGFEDLLRANCTFVAVTLAAMLERNLLAHGARLCVVSSIWQTVARQHKLSYTVSKAAVGGLVRSCAVDLAGRGILVNAVLPGAVDTPMTRAALTPEQLANLAASTGFQRLTSVADVVSLVCYLCSEANTGVTGQSIAVDLGYSVGRLV